MKQKVARGIIVFILLFILLAVVNVITGNNSENTIEYIETIEQKDIKEEFPFYWNFNNMIKNEYVNKSAHILTIKYQCNGEQLLPDKIVKVLYDEEYTVTYPEIDYYVFDYYYQNNTEIRDEKITSFFTTDFTIIVNYKKYIDYYEPTTVWVNNNISGSLRIRTTPDISVSDNICANVYIGQELQAFNYDAKKEWTVVSYNGVQCYTATRYLSETKVEKKTVSYNGTSIVVNKVAAGFHAYAVLDGSSWLTPEQFDAKYGYATGTTRNWQKYLYNKLDSYGIAWFYPYALAQAKQESGWNLYTFATRKNGTRDAGLFQFYEVYWNKKYPGISVFDYIKQIDVYTYNMSIWTGYELGVCLSCHKWNSPILDQSYVNAIIIRLQNHIKICD